jgi:uncharacterized protein
MSDDPHRIHSLEELRTVIGEPKFPRDPNQFRTLDRFAVEYIARSPFLVLATASREGALDASPKGDGPGFVLVEDESTLIVPDRPGNRLAMGHRNILESPHVGLIFMVPGTPETLRVSGTAELTRDPALLARLAARGRPAVLAIRVHVEECFFHCAKAFLRSSLWKPETWGETRRVSLGAWAASRVSLPPEAGPEIDAQIEESYRTEL